MTTYSVMWTSCGDPVGEPFSLTNTANSMWVPYETHTTTYPPYSPNPPTQPSTVSWTTITSGGEEEEGRAEAVKAPAPSLESILVEIAKVLREGGDILEIREIFERHKLKLIDHDGEVVFDPKDIENLEDRGL